MTTVEELLQQLQELSDEQLKRDYLNYLKWTEPIALMLKQLDEESQALRVIRLALEVDLMLGAQLSKAVKPEFQGQALSLVAELDIPQPLKEQLKYLAHLDHFAQKSAIVALGKIGSEAEVPVLTQALEDTDSSVRQKVVEAQGNISSEAVIPVLISALEDEDSAVRGSAAKALGKIGTEAAIPALIQALEDENSAVRGRAADALGKIGSDAAVPALIRVLENRSNSIRLYAAQALGDIGSRSAIPALVMTLITEDITEDNPKASWVIATALGKVGIPELLPHLSEILLTTSLYESESRHPYDWCGVGCIPGVMDAIQKRCGYYNHALIRSG
jgi:HEAT repeat protein